MVFCKGTLQSCLPSHHRINMWLLITIGMLNHHWFMCIDDRDLYSECVPFVEVATSSSINNFFLAHYLCCRRVGAGSEDPLRACSIRKKVAKRKSTSISGLRKAAVDHQNFVKGTTMYPLEHHPGHGLLCTLPKDWIKES